jgi:hypothetical protein
MWAMLQEQRFEEHKELPLMLGLIGKSFENFEGSEMFFGLKSTVKATVDRRNLFGRTLNLLVVVKDVSETL